MRLSSYSLRGLLCLAIFFGVSAGISPAHARQLTISGETLDELRDNYALLKSEWQTLKDISMAQSKTIESLDDNLTKLGKELDRLGLLLASSQVTVQQQRRELANLRSQLQDLETSLIEARRLLTESTTTIDTLERQVTGLQWWAYGATGVAAVLGIALLITM